MIRTDRSDSSPTAIVSESAPPLWGAVVVLIAARVVASFVIHLYDDAFITLRYARNLAEGVGFVYNPGEWILGTTTPGFGMLLSLFYLVDLPMPGTVVALSILCDAATLYLTWRLVCTGPTVEWGPSAAATDRSVIERGIFAFLFIASPILSRTSVGGMESSAYLLLSLGAILLFCADREKSAIALAALSYTFRPEGVILIGLLVGALLIRHGVRRALIGAAVALAVLAPYLLILYLSYGHVLSQSVLAKSILVQKASVLQTLRGLLMPEITMALLLLPAAAGMILTFMAHRHRLRQALRHPRVIIALWCLLYIAAFAVGRPKIWSWYGQPIYFAVVLFAAIAAAELFVRVTRGKHFPRLVSALAWSPILGLALWLALSVVRGKSGVSEHVYKGIETYSRSIDPTDTIAAYDIGAIGYHSNAYIYDLAGLVTPEALRFGSPDTLLKAIRPDYYFVFATKSEAAMMMNDPVLRRLYLPEARFAQSGEGLDALDTAALPTEWVQDYLLYRRVDGE